MLSDLYLRNPGPSVGIIATGDPLSHVSAGAIAWNMTASRRIVGLSATLGNGLANVGQSMDINGNTEHDSHSGKRQTAKMKKGKKKKNSSRLLRQSQWIPVTPFSNVSL